MDVIFFCEACHNTICQVRRSFKTLVRGKLRLKTDAVHRVLSARDKNGVLAHSLALKSEDKYRTRTYRVNQSPKHKPTLIICGAGIAGVSAAYFLSQQWNGEIYLIDENSPLSFTSDRSSECYRNWWSDPAMLALMNRSIDLLESLAWQTANAIHLNRRGYLYVTAQEARIDSMIKEASWIAEHGGGSLRIHEGVNQMYQPATTQRLNGADLLIGNALIRKYFSYITEKAVAALHVRRAGWLSAQQLGMVLLQKAQQNGVRFRRARLMGVKVVAGRVKGIRLSNGDNLPCDVFVNAAGPYLKEVCNMLQIDLPVENDLHLKLSLRDHLGVIGREAPLLIWNDPQNLNWNEEERQFLANDPKNHFLLSLLPPGAHVRPEGGEDSQMVLMLWDYQSRPFPSVEWPPPQDELFAEVVLRGLTTMLPGLRVYHEKMPRPHLDGGYYTHTIENRPLISPLSIEGTYVLGALSGFGIMAACAAGELLAAYILGNPLPTYSDAFALDRYQDPNYLSQILSQSSFGQL